MPGWTVNGTWHRQARARIEADFSLRQMLNGYTQLYQDAVGWRRSEQPAAKYAQAGVASVASAPEANVIGKAR